MHCLHCHTSLGVKAGVVICPTCNQSRNIDAKAVEETKIEKLISLLTDNSEHGLRRRWDRPYGQRQRGLIYCIYAAKSKEHMAVERVAQRLRADPRLAGLRVGAYHGQMPNREALKEVYRLLPVMMKMVSISLSLPMPLVWALMCGGSALSFTLTPLEPGGVYSGGWPRRARCRVQKWR